MYPYYSLQYQCGASHVGHDTNRELQELKQQLFELEELQTRQRDERLRDLDQSFSASRCAYTHCNCCYFRTNRPQGIIGGIVNAFVEGVRVVDRVLDNRLINSCASNFLEEKSPVGHIALETRNAYKACRRDDFLGFVSSIHSGGKSFIKLSN
ncbi:MAG: hypothetical protein FWC80_04380 [Firmicutes bacterium]|nr:hypothetical protein [Bacillota bacterium]